MNELNKIRLFTSKYIHSSWTNRNLIFSCVFDTLLQSKYFFTLLFYSHENLLIARVFGNNAIPYRIPLLKKNISHLRSFDHHEIQKIL